MIKGRFLWARNQLNFVWEESPGCFKNGKRWLKKTAIHHWLKLNHCEIIHEQMILYQNEIIYSAAQYKHIWMYISPESWARMTGRRAVVYATGLFSRHDTDFIPAKGKYYTTCLLCPHWNCQNKVELHIELQERFQLLLLPLHLGSYPATLIGEFEIRIFPLQVCFPLPKL